MFIILSSIILIVIFKVIIIFLIVLKAYIKLSCGYCNCSRHLVGKVVIITGGNAGIGYETAKDLAERGARIILACRSESRGIAARDKIIAASGNQDVHYRHLDMASLNSVRKFAAEIIKTEKRLDILINNAGIYMSENVQTEDGLLMAMQVNHFGPFLLTNLLLPLLKTSAPSRIINVSSGAHLRAKIDFQDSNYNGKSKNPFSVLKTYEITKLCNILMTTELSRLLDGTGVTSNCLHPGVVDTEIFSPIDALWLRILVLFGKGFFKTAREGAQTTIYLAVSPEVNEVSGRYFIDCRQRNPSKEAQSMEKAKKLWQLSEQLVNLTSKN